MDELIVVVDDANEVLSFTKDIFEDSGYTNVLTFSCPVKALEEIEKGLKPFAVVADYLMPRMNGVQLLTRITGIYPGIHGIIMTGNPYAITSPDPKYPVFTKGTMHFFTDLLNHLKNLPLS